MLPKLSDELDQDELLAYIYPESYGELDFSEPKNMYISDCGTDNSEE